MQEQKTELQTGTRGSGAYSNKQKDASPSTTSSSISTNKLQEQYVADLLQQKSSNCHAQSTDYGLIQNLSSKSVLDVDGSYEVADSRQCRYTGIASQNQNRATLVSGVTGNQNARELVRVSDFYVSKNGGDLNMNSYLANSCSFQNALFETSFENRFSQESSFLNQSSSVLDVFKGNKISTQNFDGKVPLSPCDFNRNYPQDLQHIIVEGAQKQVSFQTQKSPSNLPQIGRLHYLQRNQASATELGKVQVSKDRNLKSFDSSHIVREDLLSRVSKILKCVNMLQGPPLTRMRTALHQISSAFSFDFTTLILITNNCQLQQRYACYLCHEGEGGEHLPLCQIDDIDSYQVVSQTSNSSMKLLEFDVQNLEKIGAEEWRRVCTQLGLSKIYGIPIRIEGDSTLGVMVVGGRESWSLTHPDFEIGMDLLTSCMLDTCRGVQDIIASLNRLQQANDVHQLVMSLGDGLASYLNLPDYVDFQVGLLSRDKFDLAIYFQQEQYRRKNVCNDCDYQGGTQMPCNFSQESLKIKQGDVLCLKEDSQVLPFQEEEICVRYQRGSCEEANMEESKQASSFISVLTQHDEGSVSTSIQQNIGGIKNDFAEDRPTRPHRWSTVQIQLNGLSCSRICMEDCLLNHAINMQQNNQLPTLLYINNATNYLQRVPTPAKDLYISSGPLHSLIIVPIRYKEEYIGGLYLTSTHEIDGVHIKNKLEGIIDIIGQVIYSKLTNNLRQEWRDLFCSNTVRSSSTYSASTNSDVSSLQRLDSCSTPVRMVSNQSQTLSLVASISNELWQRQEFSNLECGSVEKLVLLHTLGQGGFGTVWKGVWNGQEVAVKVLDSGIGAVKKALEIAVNITVNHPNIVRLHACFYDVIVDQSIKQMTGRRLQSSGEENFACAKIRHICPEESINEYQSQVNVIILEYCDQGTLSDAIREGGVFGHSHPTPKTPAQMRNIVRTLLEIADAVRYLHTHQLVHCDLKPSNILLQSYLSDERGFKTRVSDFGLIHLLSDDGCSTNTTTCGTFTHMAPEQMMLGACITQKVDAYSFGIIMWEMWEGGVPYEGCGVLDLVQLVVHMNVRPTFEGDVPRSYSHLTHKCWQQDPALRPSFAEIICYLQQMLEQVTDQGYLL